MPVVAIALSVLGLIPVIICGLGSLSPVLAQATALFTAFAVYLAAVMSFLGGVHWGLALAPSNRAAARRMQCRSTRRRGGGRRWRGPGLTPHPQACPASPQTARRGVTGQAAGEDSVTGQQNEPPLSSLSTQGVSRTRVC